MPLFAPIIIALLLPLGIVSCCSHPRVTPPTDTEPPRIISTEPPSPKGTIILVHGLNQRPSTLDSLAEALFSQGHSVYRLALTGHEREGDELFSESAWERDIIDAYTRVHTRHPATPITLLGYSLGGLLITRVLDTHPEIRPARVVLLAPALSLRPLPQAGYALFLLPPLSWSVPNIAPPRYRRFAYTPLFWYRNTFKLYAATRELENSARLRQIPTLVIANPRDELVSLSGIQGWLESNQLAESWKVELVRPATHNPSIPDHVIIDEPSLGAAEWERMLAKVGNELASSPTQIARESFR